MPQTATKELKAKARRMVVCIGKPKAGHLGALLVLCPECVEGRLERWKKKGLIWLVCGWTSRACEDCETSK